MRTRLPMHLAIILAIVAAYAVAQYAPHEAVARGGIWHALAAAIVMAANALFAAVSSSWAARRIRREATNRERLLRRFDVWKKVHVAAWLFGAATVLLACRWPQLVRYNGNLEGWILLDELVILAPVVIPLLWVWARQADVEMAARVGETDDSASGASHTLDRRRCVAHSASLVGARWSLMWLYARHYLLLPLVPVLCLVMVHDVADHLAPGWQTADWAWLVYAMPLLVLALGLPSLLRWFFMATPLPGGELRERLEAAACRAKVRVRDILVWNTGGRAVNAAAVGFLPPLRYVFLTDALLERLAPHEIEAVFLHETAHLRRRHLLMRLAAMCLPVAAFVAVHAAIGAPLEPAARARPPFEIGTAATVGVLPTGVGFQPGVALMLAACVVGVLVALRQSSRICEHDADLWASRWLTPADAANAPDAAGAASTIAALRQMEAEAPPSRRRATWLHPSVRERVDFLRRAVQEPHFARRFTTDLRWTWWMMGATLASLVIVALLVS